MADLDLTHLSEAELIQLCWLSGKLDFLVLPHQEKVWQRMCEVAGRRLPTDDLALQAIRERRLVLTISRRWGKSTLSLLLALCCALENAEHTYYYVAPTQDDAKDVSAAQLALLLRTCPAELAPRRAGDTWTFPQTGSNITIGGTWDGARSLRGRSANGVVVDEAGFIPQHGATSCLSYVLASVIRPLLLTTRGWLLISSTPPASMKHDYVEVHRQAERDGVLEVYTIHDNTSLTAEQIEEERLKSLALDPTGVSWRREYLAEMVPAVNDLIIPEPVSANLHLTTYPRPEPWDFVHRYIVLDHGTVDLTAVLFGYHDFANAKKVVEASLLVPKRSTTDEIAAAIQNRREALWGPEAAVYRAIADAISHQLIVDLNAWNAKHGTGLQFVHPQKTDLEAMVNQTIIALENHSLVINDDPSNALLLDTLRTGTWKVSASGRREFARLNEIGHCDFLAALIYFNRMVITTVNPYGAIPVRQDQFRNPHAPTPETQLHQNLVAALQGPRSTFTRR